MSLDILDKSLDDIADLPSFEVPQNGTYSLKVSTEVKKVADKDSVEAKYEVMELVQADDPNAPITVAGTKFSTVYFLDNEYGVGNLKKFLVPFGEHFGTQNLRELVTEKVKDVIITATVKRRADKDDKDKFYADVKNILVV